MKMQFVMAALMMIGAAGCATTQAEPTVTEVRNDVPATVESSDLSSDLATSSDTTSSANPMGGAAPVIDEAAAPSSLGASSSGRGH